MKFIKKICFMHKKIVFWGQSWSPGSTKTLRINVYAYQKWLWGSIGVTRVYKRL